MTSITGNSSSGLWGQAVGLGLRPKKKKITLRWANYDAKDPSSYFEMDIPYETFLNKDGSDIGEVGEKDPYFSAQQRADIVKKSFQRQYDMSLGEATMGVVSHLSSGLTLGGSDELVGLFGGFFKGQEGVDKAVGHERAQLEKLSMKYPYLANTANTFGAILPVIADVLFVSKGTGSSALLAAQRASTGATIARGSKDVYNPFRLSTFDLGRGGLETAVKAGTLSGAHEFGSATGTPSDRWADVPESFKEGAVLGAGFHTGLKGLLAAPDLLKGVKETGTDTLLRRAPQAINEAVKDYTARTHQFLDPNARPLSGRAQRDLGESFFSDASPPSVAFRDLLEPQPWDTLGGRNKPMLAEGLGTNVIDPVSQLPVRDPVLPSLLSWGGQAEPVAGGAQARRMMHEGLSEGENIQSALRGSFGPFPRSVDDALNVLEQDARPVWEAFYRDAYFTPAGNPISVPLSGVEGGTGFMKMFKDEIYEKVYQRAKAKRTTNIAHKRPGTINNWDNYIDGIDQHLPSWEMFLEGKRYVPISTWGDNAAAIERAGWTRVKSRDGTYEKELGKYIVKQGTKNVDVKTLHDMRIAFDDMIALEQEAGRKATMIDARKLFDLRIKAVAPDALRLADEAFESKVGLKDAGEAGRVATSREYSTPESIRAEYEGLATPQEQRMYLSGLAEKLRSEGTTAEQILSDPTTRGNIEALFGGDEVKFGKFLQEVSSLSRSAEVRADFADPARRMHLDIGQRFGGFMWSMFAKIPAYQFSTAFAGARDLTIVARNMEKSQNKIVGQEMTRLLSARSPEELVKVLRILDEEYRRTLPKDAAELRQIAALFMTAIAANERDLYTGAASGIQAAGRGLLGAF